MRFAVGIEYDGSRYHGWQKQHSEKLITLQDLVEQAFSEVADHPVEIFCAGRTDCGVHASGQVIHFDSDVKRSEYSWVCGVNGILPRDIIVRWVKSVPDDFHARYSALSRRYHYWIYNSPTRSAILNAKVTWHLQKLAVDKMQQAVNYLLGEHDFSSFRARACQAKTAVRTIHEISITQHGPYIKMDICANAFLHHMVRNIVGMLLMIGEGERAPEDMQKVLHAKDRAQAEITAAPAGLYLVQVNYPEHYEIPLLNPVCYNG